MPDIPNPSAQNIESAFVNMFEPMVRARIAASPDRLFDLFTQSRMESKSIDVRQWTRGRKVAPILTDPSADFQTASIDFESRRMTAEIWGTKYKLSKDDEIKMGNGFGIEEVVDAASRELIGSVNAKIIKGLTENVFTTNDKVFKWDKDLMTIGIGENPFPGSIATNRQPYGGGAWDFPLSLSQVLGAVARLKRNGAVPPYYLITDIEAEQQLRADDRVSNGNFAYGKALYDIGFQIQQGVIGIVSADGLPLVEAKQNVPAGVPKPPAKTLVQHSYLIAPANFQLRWLDTTIKQGEHVNLSSETAGVGGIWNATITVAESNNLYRNLLVSGGMGFIRMEEGAVVAIESHVPETHQHPQDPEEAK